jgi:hypothetical protein
MIQVQPDDEIILILEKRLQDSLHKVQPSQDFINRLGQRLANRSGVVIEQPRKTAGFLIVFSGLLIGIILVWLLIPKKN